MYKRNNKWLQEEEVSPVEMPNVRSNNQKLSQENDNFGEEDNLMDDKAY